MSLGLGIGLGPGSSGLFLGVVCVETGMEFGVPREQLKPKYPMCKVSQVREKEQRDFFHKLFLFPVVFVFGLCLGLLDEMFLKCLKWSN